MRAAVIRAQGEAEDDANIETSFGAFDPLLGAVLPWEEGSTEAAYQAVEGEAVRADYLVQFFAPIGQPARDAVAHSGAKVVGFFPHNALVVAASEAQKQALTEQAIVRAVVPMPPVLRVHPSLFDALPGSHGRPQDGPAHLNVRGRVDVLVEVDEPAHLALIDEALAESASEVLHDAVEATSMADVRAVHVQLDRDGLAALGRMAEVVAIAPYPTWKLLNERASALVQSGAIDNRLLHRHGLDGSGQIVAYADTGLHTKSCFFRGRGKVAAYQDFAGNSRRVGDLNGHGTHVAGSIAGEDKNMRDSGVAPKARLVVQNCALTASDMAGLGGNPAPLLHAALDAGAFIHTNSWGIEDPSYTPISRAVDRFAYEHPQMVVLAAVGNTGEVGLLTVHAPASAKNVVAVGAFNSSDPSQVAGFSSQGPTDDNRIKPLVIAPGVGVRSARFGKDCGTQALSGTSMATPLVAGGVALLRQYFMEGRYPDGVVKPGAGVTPSAALLKALLVAGASPIEAAVPQPGRPTPAVPDRWMQGFGRARLDRALALDAQDSMLYVSDNEVALDTGEVWQACFDVAAAARVDVALVWSDPPPKREGVAVALIQNLDLELVDAHGRRALGNAGLDGGHMRDVADDRNVEEVVRAHSLPAGRTCVRVVAKHTPELAQTFAVALLSSKRSPVLAARVQP